MARKVRISAVAPKLFLYNSKLSLEETTELAIKHLDYWISKVLPDKPDLIVLSEECDRPDGMDSIIRNEYYQVRGNLVLEYLQSLAQMKQINIAYTAHLYGIDNKLRNSTVFIDRNGNICGRYHKNHLTIAECAETDSKYGKDAELISLDFGHVAGIICFDLNFDELREIYVKARPDLLVFSSLYHGGFIQKNWAYTCRSYFIGAVAGLPCSIINPLGEVIAQSTNYYPYVTQMVNLDYVIAHLDYNWERLDALRKKYGLMVTVYEPGLLGTVLITSESDEISALEMVNEFEIELLDDYLARSRQNRYASGKMEE